MRRFLYLGAHLLFVPLLGCEADADEPGCMGLWCATTPNNVGAGDASTPGPSSSLDGGTSGMTPVDGSVSIIQPPPGVDAANATPISEAGAATAREGGAPSEAGAGASEAGAGASEAGAGAMSSLPPVTDYTKAGPFKTTMISNVGPNNDYTIFRPDPLGENGFKHPPVIFGCGIATTPSWYTTFLSRIASHGFVLVASNSSGVNQQLMQDGLTWILEQNDKAGDYQGKLDVKRAVSMGYSIGGTAAVLVGAHASVVTTVSIHGHDAQSALHGPLLQTTGTNDSVGLPLQQGTFDKSKVQTFLATLQNASHFEILGGEDLQDIVSAAFGDGDGGRELGPIVAWLRYWVFNDQGAKSFFYGDDCTLCKTPWMNPQRKNWQ
jgi:hypothetical protein